MNRKSIVILSVIGTFLAIVLSIGIWNLGWFVTEQNVEERTRIDNTRTGTQVAWRDEARNTIRDYYTLPEDATGAKAAHVNQACELIAKLTDQFREQDLSDFEEEFCNE